MRRSHEIQIHNKNAFGMGNGVDGIVIKGQDPTKGESGTGRNSSDEITPTKESKQE